MPFAQPLWLAAGVLACGLLAWSWRRFDARQRTALAQFAAARLLPKLTLSLSPRRRRLKRGLVLAGLALLFTALARPQSGYEIRETHRRGLELVFAIDTSKSMLAQDVKPDRLTRARLGVTDLVARLQGDGVGLIAFAGEAFLQCPVTLDYNAFRESLNAIDTNSIPVGGTNIAAAIREAEAVFAERGSAEKILVLITDGEDLGGDGITAAEAASQKGVRIFTVGVGSSGGELIPVPTANGGTEFARDDKGQLVKSKLDEATLRKIAEVSGGMYQPLGPQVEGLNAIYDQGLANLTRSDLSSRGAKVPLERFQWPLLAALLCFIADWVIGNRRRHPTATANPASATPGQQAPPPLPPARKKLPSPPARATVGSLSLLTILSTAALSAAPSARAAAADKASPQSAEQAYQKGDYSKAHADYAATAAAQPAKPELQYNTGSAAYKAGDYAQALSGFQESLKNAPVPVQQDAYYNLGNTQYRMGQQTLKDNKPDEAIKTWEEAVKSYEAALQINSSDSAAKHNRDLVKRKIEQLKKQQEDQKNQDKDKDKDQKKDGDQDKKDQQDKQDDSQKDPQDKNDQNKDSKDSGDNKDQKDQPQDSKDSKDQQGQDSKDQSGDSKDPSDSPQDSKDPSQDGKSKDGEDQKSKDSKDGDAPKPEDSQDPKKPGDDQTKEDQKPGEEPKPEDAKDGDKSGGKDGEKKDAPQAGSEGNQKDQAGKDSQPGKDQPEPQPQEQGPDQKTRQGEIQSADGSKPPPAADPAAAADRVRAAPGQMTREEAKQLLDALRMDERRLPARPFQGRAGSPPKNGPKLKDW